MLRPTMVSLYAAAVASLVLVSTAVAGGWSVATLDAIGQMEAGQSYRIGFMMRQHGVAPVRGATPSIVLKRGGVQQTFAALPDGMPGHYVADVTFPGDGEWTWSVDQQPFQSQSLGTIVIQAAPAVMAVVPGPSAPDIVTAAREPFAPLKRQPPAELALLGMMVLAGLGIAVALRQLKRGTQYR